MQFQLVHWWFAGLEPYDFLMKGIVTMTMGYQKWYSQDSKTPIQNIAHRLAGCNPHNKGHQAPKR
jgi:regulation of enolase protein 1 (concanavalin A-like superfamily)